MDSEVEVRVCVSCSVELGEDEAHTTDSGEYVCMDCLFICEKCDGVSTVDDDRYPIDGGYTVWCYDCTESYANWCNCCDQHHTGDTYYAEDRQGGYCEGCIGDAYYCDNCNDYYFDGCDCAEREAEVHDYSYKPDPIFHKVKDDERLFFGMEIEVESPNEDYDTRRDASEYASEILESSELAYLKSDGSLSCGFEIVTHPMSHDFFKNQAKPFWDVVGSLRNEWNMKSWSARSAGLHIHISRAGFNNGSHMHRFLQLVYDNEDFYSRIAGRRSERWAKFDDIVQWNDARQEHIRTFKHKLDNRQNSDRYSAINTQNRHTLEMRIFRSTLNADTIKSMLDLAHASVEYTRRLSVIDIRNGALSCINLIQYIHDNKDTYEHLVSRMSRLFIASNDSE